jgi:Cys-tRNA(Pro)/Cys-tRNA(Cys) deacylase
LLLIWPAAGTGQERDGGSVDRASVDAERGRAARSIAEMATIDPKTMERTAAGTRALEVIVQAGVSHEVHAYEAAEPHGRDRDRRPSYGIEAAQALGTEPARVFKSLAVAVDGRLVLAVIPVDRELDPKRLADALAGRRAVMAEPAEAERATGYVVGGISPLGTRRSLPVVVDSSATEHDTIFISAGRRGLQVELAPADLIRLSAAQMAQLTRDVGRD